MSRNDNRYGSSYSSAGYRPRTGPEAEAAAAADLKRRRIRRAIIFAVAVGALAFSAGWNPPTTTVHHFTEASNYNPNRESGCTNSGAGCHGDEAEYKDFNVYHPDTDCGVCHEYEGVGCIPCHAPSQRECAACHDGTLDIASDVVRLSDPYPNGHYRETTHTAMGTDMSVAVRSSKAGEASLTCEDCHSRSLQQAHTTVPVVAGSDYGPDIGCYECHNDVRAKGQAEVLADWTNDACEDCHAIGTSSVMHATDVAPSVEASAATGCSDSGQGCHVSADLHALHPDAPRDCSGSAEDGEPICHNVELESFEPTMTACGGGEDTCHADYVNGELSHDGDTDAHSPTTRIPASNTSYASLPCGVCHAMTPDGTSLITEHALPTSARTQAAGDDCKNCHNHPASEFAFEDEWDDRNSSEACSVCHDGVNLDAAHEGGLETVHVAQDSAGCADSGIGCHPTHDLTAVGSSIASPALHRDCLRCHDRTASDGNGSYDPDKKSCGDGRACHAEAGAYDPATAVHAGSGQVDGRDIAHRAGPGQGDYVLANAGGVRVTCDACHSMTLATEHGRDGAALDDEPCAACHNANATTARIVKTSWLSKNGSGACASCHDGSGAPAMHAQQDSAHQATEIGTTGLPDAGACAEQGCHATADLRVLHSDIGCTISGCHSATGSLRGTTASCGGPAGAPGACHAGSERHADIEAAHEATEISRFGEPEVGSCTHAGCHATINVRAVHADALSCATPGCHVEGGPSGVMSCGGTADTQGACHIEGERHYHIDELHTATEVNRHGEVEAGACAKSGCHPTPNVRALHEEGLSCYETPGCHVEGGPSGVMTCGGTAETENACHIEGERHAEIDTAHNAVEVNRHGEVEPGACAKAGCHATTNVRELHEEGLSCYETPGCHVEGGPSGVMTCGGTAETENACHIEGERHADIDEAHTATEINRHGEVEPGACAKAGCHATTNVRELHEEGASCYQTAGCHLLDGPSGIMSCGGDDETTGSCHIGSLRHAFIEERHTATEINRYGEPEEGACAKAGCHATTNVRELHEEGLSCYETPSCHVEGGPSGVMSCGGTADTENSCHIAGQRHELIDQLHAATEINRYGIPEPGACAHAGCHATTNVRELHEEGLSCYETPGCHVEGGPSGVMSCGGPADQQGACHISGQRHYHMEAVHTATELNYLGEVEPGACVTAGCHATTNVRTLHEEGLSCYGTEGCHVEGGPSGAMRCGGSVESTSTCHPLYRDSEHFYDHAADLTGTVGGVTYGPGENDGCLGTCHYVDLQTEHQIRLNGGGLEGGGTTVCAVCHDTVASPGSFADLPAVGTAIVGGDRRCIACHASGSSSDGPTAVASPTAACVPALPTPSIEPVATPAVTVKPNAHDSLRSKEPLATPSAEETPSPSQGATSAPEPTLPPEATATPEPSPQPEPPITTPEPSEPPSRTIPCPGEPSDGDKPGEPTTGTAPPRDPDLDQATCLTCHTKAEVERGKDAR